MMSGNAVDDHSGQMQPPEVIQKNDPDLCSAVLTSAPE